MGVNRLGADELPSPGSAALRIELHDAGLDRDPPRPRADATVTAPGIPILQRRRHRRTAPPRIEPAASFPVPFNREGSPPARRMACWTCPAKLVGRARTPPTRRPPIRAPPRSRILPGRSRKSSSSRAMA